MKKREFTLTMAVTEHQVDALVVSSLQQSILDAMVAVRGPEDFSTILSMLVVLEYYMQPEDWQVYSNMIMPDVRDLMASHNVEFW